MNKANVLLKLTEFWTSALFWRRDVIKLDCLKETTPANFALQSVELFYRMSIDFFVAAVFKGKMNEVIVKDFW